MKVARKKPDPRIAARREERKRFLAALALADMGREEWGRANGVSEGHLSRYLSGKRDSETLGRKIRDFTERQLGDVAA